eukprot:1194797-Prorocentrum_minimum.AAC.1
MDLTICGNHPDRWVRVFRAISSIQADTATQRHSDTATQRQVYASSALYSYEDFEYNDTVVQYCSDAASATSPAARS